MGQAAEWGITPTAMDPALKARIMAEAAVADEAKGRDLLDVAEANTYGKRQRWIRMAEGAAAAFVAVAVVSALRRKRR